MVIDDYWWLFDDYLMIIDDYWRLLMVIEDYSIYSIMITAIT
jgi:hypothetical protein